MSRRSDRATGRKAVTQAEAEFTAARTAARKAFDLKDPRFLGEAALAATRGPVGLALFGASRGLQVVRDRRAEQAELLGNLAADARQHADSLRERTSELVAPPEKRGALRRFAPLWIVGLAGGAAVAGAAAYFLRDPGSSAPVAATSPARPGGIVPVPAPEATGVAPGADTPSDDGGSGDPETGADLTIESPDPEGPADQADGTSPAAGEPAPGPAAGSAPQPSDDATTDGGTPDTDK